MHFGSQGKESNSASYAAEVCREQACIHNQSVFIGFENGYCEGTLMVDSAGSNPELQS